MHGEGRYLPEAIDKYVAGLPKKITPSKSAANLYEIRHTGQFNYRVSGGGEAFNIDGYRGTTILEAKHVGTPRKSPFIPGSNIPDDVRAFILDDVRDELLRVRTIIRSGDTPFKSIEIITNTKESKAFFERLLREFSLPGSVRLEL